MRRLGMLTDDAIRVGLPSFPARDKKEETRYAWFCRQYGDPCWARDAMPPNDGRAMVQAAIEDAIDWPAGLRGDAVETAERRALHQRLGTWRSGIAGPATRSRRGPHAATSPPAAFPPAYAPRQSGRGPALGVWPSIRQADRRL